MRVSIIVAMDRNGLIGTDNHLPWHLPADLKYFKITTMGKPIVMGRKTHESIGRALPGRRNIVVTSNPYYHAEQCDVAVSLADALEMAVGADEVMIIGGAMLYADALPRADRIYLTRVEAELDGDTWFPPIDDAEWRLSAIRNRDPDPDNPFELSFITLERRNVGSAST